MSDNNPTLEKEKTPNVLKNEENLINKENNESYYINDDISSISENDLELETYSITLTENSDDNNCSTKEENVDKIKKQKNKTRIELTASPYNLQIIKLLVEENRYLLEKLNKNILENVENTKQINKTKEVNDVVRKIEHEEIKELIVKNSKLFLHEIKNIYNILRTLLSDISKNYCNDYNDDNSDDNEINNKREKTKEHKKKLNALIKENKNLRNYKKLYKYKKKENYILRKIFLEIQKSNSKKRDTKKWINKTLGIFKNIILENLKTKKKYNVLQNPILSKDFSRNKIFKKHLEKKEVERREAKLEIKKNKELKPYFKKWIIGTLTLSLSKKQKIFKRWYGIRVKLKNNFPHYCKITCQQKNCDVKIDNVNKN